MLSVITCMTIAIATAELHDDPATNQIVIFKERTQGPVAIMSTSAGAPIEREDTSTLSRRLLFNEFFLESLTHFNRERIPERVVHANAGGAFGYFEVTHDITDICKAKLFSKVGKTTPVAVRFSPVISESGGVDTSREPRGFAIKFYTEDGNYDLVGLNTPVFGVKDPILFPPFIKVQKRNPATNLRDSNALWDFLTLRPESLHIFLFVFGDLGVPDGYRHMPGFGIHTFQVVNEHEEIYFVRFHFIPDRGIKGLNSEEARKIGGIDPDYNQRDLYTAIDNGDFPSWTASIQVLTLDDAKNARFDVFDVTKVLPLDEYPLRPFGRLVLNRNPPNYFADIEQLAFNPANLVPGILGAPDKLFEARRLNYRDALNYRLGANFNNIAVNCPFRRRAFTYNRDGRAPVIDNMLDMPNYYPNSFNGPVPYIHKDEAQLIEIYQYEADNFDQIAELYIEMSPGEKTRAIENIVNSLRPVTQFIQERAMKIFDHIHRDLGRRVREGLRANTTKVHD